MFDDNNDANDLYEPPLETLCSNSRMKLGTHFNPHKLVKKIVRQKFKTKEAVHYANASASKTE